MVLNPQYHEEILNTIISLKALKTWKLLLPSSFFEGLKAKIDLISSTAAYAKKKESIDEKNRLLELLEKLSPYHHATSKFATRLDTLIDFQNISHDRHSFPSLNRNKALNAQEMEFLYAAYHHLALKYRYFVLVDDIPKPYYNLAVGQNFVFRFPQLTFLDILWKFS